MVDFGGSDLNMYLHKLLVEKNSIPSNILFDTESARKVKEAKCMCAFEYDKELSQIKAQNFELPDGENIRLTLQDEILKTAEACFNPNLIGRHIPGLHELVYESIRKCENELRRDMFSNII